MDGTRSDDATSEKEEVKGSKQYVFECLLRYNILNFIYVRSDVSKTRSRLRRNSSISSDWVAIKTEADENVSDDDAPSGDEEEQDELLDEGEEVESDIEKVDVK